MRTAVLARRAALSKDFIAAQGEPLLAQVRTLDAVATAQTVAAYVSMGTEIPTFPLLRWLLESGKRVLIPRLGTGREIGWSYLSDMNDLTGMGKHRPEEPEDATVLGIDAIGAAEAVILPALFVDSQGYRLGRGAGWYDRTLAFRHPDSLLGAVVYPWEAESNTPTASIMTEFAGSEQVLPHGHYDVPVTHVITAETVLRIR